MNKTHIPIVLLVACLVGSIAVSTVQADYLVAGWYDARLEKIAGIKKPFIAPTTTYTSWFVYVIQLEQGIERDMVINDLAANGIPSRPYFTPIHLQDYMVEMFGYRPGDYPVTEKLGCSGLALPFSGVMTEEQVETVCRTIQEIL